MSATVDELLNNFDRLPEAEKQEVASQIIKRARNFEIPPLTDDELVLNAEPLFLELDRRELEDEQSE